MDLQTLQLLYAASSLPGNSIPHKAVAKELKQDIIMALRSRSQNPTDNHFCISQDRSVFKLIMGNVNILIFFNLQNITVTNFLKVIILIFPYLLMLFKILPDVTMLAKENNNSWGINIRNMCHLFIDCFLTCEFQISKRLVGQGFHRALMLQNY